MGINTQHPDYAANLRAWQRARDVVAGEEAIKAAGDKYLPRLVEQDNKEYDAYKGRALFFNATSRTVDGYLGMIFRREPTVKLPDKQAGVGGALRLFVDDCDLMGTSLSTYCKAVIREVLVTGRAGTLVDWEGASDTGGASGTGNRGENRAYVVRYAAEDIINWQVGRVNGRTLLVYLALTEAVDLPDGAGSQLQIRVLRLDQSSGSPAYVSEVWRKVKGLPAPGLTAGEAGSATEWRLVIRKTPLRLGRPLTMIPFVFHGPRHSLPAVDDLPLKDMIFCNLDHYRLDADYKHGLHWTALPTPWVAGFKVKEGNKLRLGSSIAWTSDQLGATAGFLEFKGAGLSSFVEALEANERKMAVLGSRMLEATKRVGETVEAIELRQSGENSVLQTLALSVSDSLSHVLRWVYWWNSTEASPELVGEELVILQLNTDFAPKGMTALELQATVAAWQAGAISRATMFDLFRKGEVLPVGRTDEEEERLIAMGIALAVAAPQAMQNGRDFQGGVLKKDPLNRQGDDNGAAPGSNLKGAMA